MDLPTGFEPIFRTSPFLETIGPVFSRGQGEDLSIGLRIADKHCNARGSVHGGVLASLCDIALGYAVASSSRTPLSLVTTNLNISFSAGANVGDWIHSKVQIQRKGRRAAFANCYLLLGERPVVHASAVYLVADA